MKIEHVALEDLRALEDNPRVIGNAQLARLRGSLAEYGLFKPLLIWRDPDGAPFVIGGNQRLRVLTSMQADQSPQPKGVIDWEIPCIEFGGTRAQARAVALRDNNADGDWDWDELPNYLASLQTDWTEEFGDGEVDWSILTGFDAAMLDDLVGLTEDPLIGLTQFAGEPDQEPKEQHSGERGQMRFAFGKLRGNVRIDLYERFAQVFQDTAAANDDTKDLNVVLGAMLDALEAE